MNKMNKKAIFGIALACGASALLSPPALAAYSEADYSGSAQPQASNQSYQPYYTQVAVAPAPAAQSAGTQTPAVRGSFFSPTSERIISDPLYLPLKGQVYGTTSYTFTNTNDSSYNYRNVKTSDATGASNNFTQSLAYGLTDDFTVRMSEAFAFGDTNSENVVSGAKSTSYVNGFTDPTFGFTYRAVDQKNNHPVDVDVAVSYTPDMIESKAAGGGHTGTEAPGRQSATFSANIGREMRGFTIEGIGGATYNGTRNFQYLSNNDLGTTSDFWNYFVAVDTQTRVTDRLSFNGNIRLNGQENYSGANQTSGLAYNAESPGNIDFTAALNYHFIPNRLVGQLSYDNVIYSNTKYTYDSVPRDDSEVKNEDSNIVAVRLLYTFN